MDLSTVLTVIILGLLVYYLIDKKPVHREQVNSSTSEKDTLYPKIDILDDFTVIIITDTHGTLREQDLWALKKPYDVCFLLGDIDTYDMQLLDKYMDKTKTFGVLGNHDYKEMYESYGVEDIHGRDVCIKGVTFAGFEGSAKYKYGDYIMYTQEESIEVAKTIPPADILISHDCSYNLVQVEEEGAHSGLKGITEYISMNHVRYNFCGHYHRAVHRNHDMCDTYVFPYGVSCIEKGVIQHQE